MFDDLTRLLIKMDKGARDLLALHGEAFKNASLVVCMTQTPEITCLSGNRTLSGHDLIRQHTISEDLKQIACQAERVLKTCPALDSPLLNPTFVFEHGNVLFIDLFEISLFENEVLLSFKPNLPAKRYRHFETTRPLFDHLQRLKPAGPTRWSIFQRDEEEDKDFFVGTLPAPTELQAKEIYALLHTGDPTQHHALSALRAKGRQK